MADWDRWPAHLNDQGGKRAPQGDDSTLLSRKIRASEPHCLLCTESRSIPEMLQCVQWQPGNLVKCLLRLVWGRLQGRQPPSRILDKPDEQRVPPLEHVC